MSRTIRFVFLAVGIALLVMGIMASQKAGEQVLSGLTGYFTNKTTWYILGGVVLIIIGGMSNFKKR